MDTDDDNDYSDKYGADVFDSFMILREFFARAELFTHYYYDAGESIDEAVDGIGHNSE